jgi:hypothetical protein
MGRVCKRGGGVRFNLKRGQVGLFAGERKEGICGGVDKYMGIKKGKLIFCQGLKGNKDIKTEGDKLKCLLGGKGDKGRRVEGDKTKCWQGEKGDESIRVEGDKNIKLEGDKIKIIICMEEGDKYM